jgi:molybdopterin molybdotransferase
MSDTADLYSGSLAPDEAVRKLAARVARVTETETVPVTNAAGRLLAGDMVAGHDLPASNNAAVDGYALDASFLATHPEHDFPVVGRAAAGHPFQGAVAAGMAVRIFTGAVMPHGTDAVAMQEFCTADEAAGSVRIGRPVKPGANNRPAGENLRKGELIAATGCCIGPAEVGIAAAAGNAHIKAFRRLRVGLLSMGDEVVEAGSPTGPGQLHDSNRPMLATLLEGDGHAVHDFGIVPDSAESLTHRYQDALASCDAVISSGGASDGDEDHTQEAMRRLNITPVFWRLAIKPGRPMAAGLSGSGAPVLCLPGNPVAAFVCYRLVAAPVLAIMAGGTPPAPIRCPVRSGFAHRKSPGRAEYLRVRLVTGQDGETEMVLHGRKGAGVLSSLTGAHGLVEIPVENDGVAVGDYLTFIPFRESAL